MENLRHQITKLKREKAYAWGQYYGELSNRFYNSYNQVQTIRAEIKKEIPEHIKTMLKNMIRKLEQEIKCPICLDEIEGKPDMAITNCGHFFCKECFDELKKKNPVVRCPSCRSNNA